MLFQNATVDIPKNDEFFFGMFLYDSSMIVSYIPKFKDVVDLDIGNIYRSSSICVSIPRPTYTIFS